MARGKSVDGADENAVGGKVSGMEAVRRTLKKLGYDVKTQAAKDHILKEYGLNLTNNKVSAYKSNIRRDAGLTRSRGGHSNNARGAALQMKDIQAVKDLVGRLGANQVRDLIAVFHS